MKMSQEASVAGKGGVREVGIGDELTGVCSPVGR